MKKLKGMMAIILAVMLFSNIGEYFGINTMQKSMIVKAAAVTEREKNDTFSNATAFSIGDTIKGALSTVSDGHDVDVFRFPLSEEGNVAFTITAYTSHYSLYLYDDSGKNLWRAEGYASNETTGYRTDTHTIDLLAGTYYIEVTGYRQYFTYATGNYEIQTSFTSVSSTSSSESSSTGDSKSKKTKKDLKIKSVRYYKKKGIFKGQLSVKGATVKIKVGKRKYKKAKVKGKTFTLKCKSKNITGNPEVWLKVKKSGYYTFWNKFFLMTDPDKKETGYSALRTNYDKKNNIKKITIKGNQLILKGPAFKDKEKEGTGMTYGLPCRKKKNVFRLSSSTEYYKDVAKGGDVSSKKLSLSKFKKQLNKFMKAKKVWRLSITVKDGFVSRLRITDVGVEFYFPQDRNEIIYVEK